MYTSKFKISKINGNKIYIYIYTYIHTHIKNRERKGERPVFMITSGGKEFSLYTDGNHRYSCIIKSKCMIYNTNSNKFDI